MSDTRSTPGFEWRQPLIIALQLLTRIPTPNIGLVDNAVVGRSLLWYPLVGGVIGVLLWGAQLLLNQFWPQQWLLQSALLLAFWCLLTGGLHLDGLADSADAWVGGFGDRERTLLLMKDPTCGPVAVMVMVLVLLVKYAALVSLLAFEPLWLILVPIVARGYLLLLFLLTPYVREGGLGEVLSRHFSHSACRRLLIVMALLLLALGSIGVKVMVLTLGSFWALRRMMNKRLGGTTGDTAGALVELQEAAALLALSI